MDTIKHVTVLVIVAPKIHIGPRALTHTIGNRSTASEMTTVKNELLHRAEAASTMAVSRRKPATPIANCPKKNPCIVSGLYPRYGTPAPIRIGDASSPWVPNTFR